MMEPNQNPEAVKLEAECHVADDALRVHYLLHNRGSAPLIAYDAATGAGQWPDLTKQLSVSYRSSAEVELKRIRPAPPQGMKLTYVTVPMVTQTMPGEIREVRFSLALPVAESNDYFPPDSSIARYETQTVHRVTLSVGFFWKLEGTELRPLMKDGSVFHASGRFGQQLFVAASCIAPVTVRVRTDTVFQRQ
jgi:hypothetical protein